MKKIFIFVILIFLLAGCDLLINPHPPIREHDTGSSEPIVYFIVTSTDMFSVNGVVYTQHTARQGSILYNPNSYSIVVSIDGVDHVIAEKERLEI